MIYLVQRYVYMGTPRVSIYLYSANSNMNSMSKICHQVDAEISGLALGHKETKKVIESLKEIMVKVDRTILVSDSQTCL